MTDEPENLVLAMLREMRAEIQERDARILRDLDAMREQTNLIPELSIAVAALSADLKATKSAVEEIRETQQSHGARLNAIEGRLAIIEKNAGLVKA